MTDIATAPPDHRFTSTAWQAWPFDLMRQSFLMTEQWWRDACALVPGVSRHQQDLLSFTVKQMLDTASPANFIWSNPEVLARTATTAGANLWQGMFNFVEDEQRLQTKARLPGLGAYEVGRDVAVTPGRVIFRNRLMELIQYEATGGKVWAQPILIVPAWIMKYYILDLSPHNSLIKYLVEHGHTVFAISWLNPTAQDRDLGMEDYLRLGVMAAMEAVSTIVPKQQIQGVGYCLGGTLLSIAAAAMARDLDTRLASVSLLAAQTDFSEPGGLSLFIDEQQITAIEKSMWKQGYLDSAQMGTAFQLINANDLIWSRMTKDYLLGERAPLSDLAAWNADGTRMPYRMHSEYLRRLFLNNDLAKGDYPAGGKPVTLSDIQFPVFCIGTANDQVAPWRSVYKLHGLVNANVTFLLTSGGHNVGIVNPPGVPGRSFQMLARGQDAPSLEPDAWLAAAPSQEGSWWPAWEAWLQEHAGKRVPPPSMGNDSAGYPVLDVAPGRYVLTA